MQEMLLWLWVGRRVYRGLPNASRPFPDLHCSLAFLQFYLRSPFIWAFSFNPAKQIGFQSNSFLSVGLSAFGGSGGGSHVSAQFSAGGPCWLRKVLLRQNGI